MSFSIGSSGESQERSPLPELPVRKLSKENIQRGLSLDRDPHKEEVASSASLTGISPWQWTWQWTAHRHGGAVLGTMEATDSAPAISLRDSVSAQLEAEEASSSDEESETEDVGGVSEEARESIAQLRESKSIEGETASDSVARVLAAQKSASPIFFPEKKGHIHEVKLLLRSLPNELYGLADPTDPTVVLDSETGQKDKASLKLLTQIMAVLSDLSLKNPTLLDTPYSGLSKQDGKIDASVTSFLDKVQEKTAPNSLTLKALLTSTIQGLNWKLAYVGDETGKGGILTANHLGVQRDTALFSRSARFNSPDKMKAVLEGAAWQESQKLTRVLEANSDSAIAELFNAFGTEAGITKEAAQKLNTFFRKKGVHLYIETSQYSADEATPPPKLCMMTNLISAMDSTKKDEKPFWDSLRDAHQIYKEALTFTDKERVIRIEPPLLTESSQSSFAAGTIALYHPSEKPRQTKLNLRKDQLDARMTLLKNQERILGTDGCKFTPDFKGVLGETPLSTEDLKGLAKNLSGAEKAFVDYMIILRDPDYQGDFDRFFTPATNVMTLEMGDVAFAELCGIHDHVSCKSGQDRTLTLTALRLAIADAGWPSPTEAEAEYKSKFAVAFFATVARQGTSVVEHARGPGGVLKFNLGEQINEQPIPGALFRYMESDLESIKKITQNEILREGLQSVKMPRGIFQVNVRIADVMPKAATEDDKRLLGSFFTKKQSAGKKTLLALFQKTVEIDHELKALQNPKMFEGFDDGEKIKELTPQEKKAKLQAWEAKLEEALRSAEAVQPKPSTRAMVGVNIKTAQTTQLKAYFKQYATRVLVNIQAEGDEKVSLHKAIEKHKASTESQLEVALSNFELAAGRFKIDPYDITQEVAKLRSQHQTAISKAYTEGTDLKTIDRTFRDKEDDFGLTATLKEFLAKSGTPTGAQGSKQAMEKTKAAAIDRQGETKSTQGFTASVTLPKNTQYTTEIQKKTSRFVSSASNESVGNTAGNLNLQTLRNAAGKVFFKTLRHAALTAEPNTETADPLNPFITAADRASLICKLPFAEANTALGKYGLEASTFKGLLSGKLDEKSLAKKLAKQCGLLNKALDVAKAAWEEKGQPDGPVTITSLSLMTPDRPRAGLSGKGGEIGKLNDQVEAFRLLAKLTPTDLKNTRMFSEKGASLDNLKFEVMTFNFGVNEGESLGATHQKRLNDEAIAELRKRSDTKTAALAAAQLKSSDPAERARLTVERDTVTALQKNIDALYTTYTQPFKYHTNDLEWQSPLGKKLAFVVNPLIHSVNEVRYAGNSVRNQVWNPKGWWRADQAYNLTAKIAFLTELCEGVNTCNCASGKDRTGMHVQNALNYAALMRDRMEGNTEGPINLKTTWEMITPLTDSYKDKAELQALQARNRAFMLETGQHEVQEWNTGSPGYKLYSSWPANLVTRGGQTEKYFMRMFGFTAAEVAEWVTMQAKYNDT